MTSLLAAIALSPYPGPKVVAASAVILDAGSGKVLWARDANAPRPPASTTKILTALLLLENTRPGDLVTAPPDIEKTGESSMHLKPGERVSARDLTYAIMLRSANDGCVAAADHVSGSVPAFVQAMNERARAIGCQHTQFRNPNGLNDPLHLTTAYDLALMGREAMRNAEFRQIVRTRKHLVKRSLNPHDRWMVSRNKWLWKDPTADGIKTGYTNPAGHCYVGSATRDGFRVITAILDSDQWQADHQAMLDWAFARYAREAEFHAGDVVGDVAVPNGASPHVGAYVGANEYVLSRRLGGAITRRVEPEPGLAAPVKRRQRVGELVLTDADGFSRRVPVYAAEDIPVAPPRLAGPNAPTLALGGLLALGYLAHRRRARRRLSYGVR